MKIDPKMTDGQLLKLIGERVAQLRLAKNLTQEELAVQAALGVRTVKRLELGEAATQLSGFLRICRALGVLDGLDTLLPEAATSPMALLKMHGRKRRRASGSRVKAVQEPKAWTWGESP